MIGSTLSNRYQILAELGRGGMGVVYRALDPMLNREVAVKLIPPTLLTPETEQRFQREAQLVAQMDHPAVVPIFDFGKHEGSLFFVMPVVQGTNLRWFEREGALTLGEVLDIGIQIAEALEYSHSRGVIHRDIKPENIMVTREEGDRVRVRIMDFGLARGAAESRITKTGTIAGTLAYMSPEQVAASGMDHRSDIYSLGTVLYECLTGEPPFSGELQSILYRIVHEIPQPPRSLGADINEDLEAAVLSCIAKEPAKRPQRATEVAEALRRCQTRLNHSDLTRSVVMTKTMMLPRVALSPFIGREKELGELQKRLNAAIGGECQFVVVSGEPGSGKTRLLDEIENLAKARKLLVLHGRSIEKDGAFPYQGFCEAIQEYFRLKEAPTSGSGAIELTDIAPDLLSLFPMLTEISEIRSAVTGESKISQTVGTQGPDNRTHVFELLARTLTRIAGGKPLILLLEDLHAAEISIEALQYIVRRLGPTPTLIAATYRSTDVDQRHPLMRMLETFRGDRRFSTIALGQFSPSEHRLFLETLIGGPKLADVLVERLYEATEGNPFFTKELVRSLLDSGGITKDQTGAWGLSGATDLSTGELPATIQQAVEKRIERLPENLREILSIASVIGRAFDFRELQTLAEGKDVEEAVDHLIEDGLIEEERESRGDRLTFSSGVVRDVLYSGIPRRKRRSLHRKYAEQIEKRHSGRLERIYPQLVHHFSQGDVPDKTVEYALRLAKNALDAFSAEDALRAAKTALDFLDEEWEGEAGAEGEARMLLAQAHQMAGDIDGALKEAESSIRIFERENQIALTVKPLLFAAETAWQARRVEETTRWVNKGIEAAQNSGDDESLRHMLSLAATLANLRGVYDKANEYLEQAERLAPTAKGTEAQEEIPRGGKLVVALATPVEVVEPVNMELVEEQEILANVYETLLTLDPEGNLMPALCERWEISGEGTSLLLTLRSRVGFQDGHGLTAEDVKRSFERSVSKVAREMPAAFAAIRGVKEFSQGEANEVVGILVHSEQRLEIQLLEPLSIYPALLTDYKTALTRDVAAGGLNAAIPLGTGPFRLASYARDRILLERNEDYWKGTSAPLDAIEFRPGLSASAIAAGLRTGEIDLARDLSPEDLDDFLRDPRFRGGLVEVPRKTTYFVLFNTTGNSAATDLKVRQALSGVVRTHDLVWQTLGRFAQPAVCVIPPGMLGHDPGKRRNALTREQAQELLSSAGMKGQIHLRASVHPLFQDRYKSLLTALFSIWSELGVQVENVTSTMAPYLESFQQSAGLDLFIGRWNADYDDPDDFTHGLFHSRVGQFRSYISASDGDQILAEARTESRPNVRASLYRKYENYLLETATVLPLFHDIDYRLANSKVLGLKLGSGAPYVNYAELGRLESSATGGETPLRTGSGIIHVPITGLINSIDPALAATVEDGEVLPNIFETLTTEVGARIVPWLAAAFHMEEGGKRYRFRLREDVRFHDGRRLTARDVRYSLERLLLSPGSISRWFYTNIRGARALLNAEARDLIGFRIQSAHDFTIELEEPISFFPAMISYSAAAIVPEGSERLEGNWQEGVVGTGPFRIVKFDPGHRLELERNKNYWRKGYPKSESLVFSFGVAPADILSEFRAGRFSVASDLLPADAEALRREPEFASSYRESPRLITYYAAFNTHRGPLRDKSLRQSLVRSIDVPSLVRQTLGRLAVPARGLFPPGLLGLDSAQAARSSMVLPPTEQRSAEIELTAVLNPVFFGEFAAMSRELAKVLREQRVKFRVMNKTMEEWLDAASKGSVDMVVGRWAADYPDPDTFAAILTLKEGLLGHLCGSPELDRLIERGRAETSPTARHAIYRQMEELITQEVLLLPLFHEQTYRFSRPEVEGLSLSYSAPAVDYASLRT